MYTFDEFKQISILECELDSFIDVLAEQIININFENINEASLGDKLKAALSLKLPKLKKALKEYQRDLIDQALNDVDYEKRREAAGKENPEVKARLDSAHKTKNDQLKARAQADIEKINDIADGNKGVEAVAKTGKIEARIKAAEIAYKHADGQEKDALKIRIDDLKDDKKETLADIKAYKSEQQEEEPPAKKQPSVTDSPKPKDDVVTPPADKAVPQKVVNQETSFTQIPDPNYKELEYLRNQIEEATENWEEAKEKASQKDATTKDKLAEIDKHKKVIDAKIKLAKVKGEGANVIDELQRQLVELEDQKLQINGGGEILTALINARDAAKDKWNEAKEIADAEKDNENKQKAAKRAELAYYRTEKTLAKAKGEDTKGWEDRIIELQNILNN